MAHRALGHDAGRPAPRGIRKMRLGLIWFSVVLVAAYFAAVLVASVAMTALNPWLDEPVNQQTWQKSLRGPYALMTMELERHPVERWPARMQELQQSFGFPVQLVQIHESGLSPHQQQELLKGEIITQLADTTFYARAGNTTYVMKWGPIDSDLAFAEPEVLWVVALQSLIILVIFTLTAAAIAWLLWRNQRRLADALAAFGAGDYSARVHLRTTSSLAPLGDTFNAMAARIETLIRHQQELAQAVSHELRTPIARLRFAAEMLKIGQPAQRDELMASMAGDLDELEAMVEELLTFSRLQADLPPPGPTPHQLATWFTTAAANHALPPPAANAVIECAADPEVCADIEPRLYARAFGNVLRNALQHARSQVIARLTVLADEPAAAIVITVDDDGPGIPAAERDRIFEPFARLDRSRDRATGGHGLGLAIARRIVQAYGGSITISDSPLGGTRLSLRFPLRASGAAAAAIA